MYEVFVKLAQERGVTAYKVAKETGISQQVFTSWKTGRSTPKQDKLKKIADYFGVSVDYLMTGETPEGKPEVTEQDIKVALFNGDKEVTDEMWEEVKNFAEMVALKYRYKKNDNNES